MLLDPETVTDDNPEGLTFLPIDPFGARPHEASRITGLGGAHPAGDETYAFQSVQLQPAIGRVCLTLTFYDLVATTGILVVRLDALSAYPDTAPMAFKTVEIALSTLVEQGGVLDVWFDSRRNMMYRIGGTIKGDTDAQAHMLGLSLTPRNRTAPPHATVAGTLPISKPAVVQMSHQRQRPELITVQPPVFARPVSQAMTAAQMRDPLVARWNQTLGQSANDDATSWENAFILQVLAYYGVPTTRASAMAITGIHDPLPSYLAGCGSTVLAGVPQRTDWPDGDPGLALERLHVPALCTAQRFFDSVDFTQFDNLAIPPELGGFDFLWSRGTSRGIADRSLFPEMLRASMMCVKPGGTVIHLIRYSGTIARPPENVADGPGETDIDPAPISYCRADIERMTLSLIAAGHEVAQLKFTVDPAEGTGDRSIPFAIVARRAL